MSGDFQWTGGTARISNGAYYRGGQAPTDGDLGIYRTGSIFVLGGEGHGIRTNLTESTLNLIYADVGYIQVNELQYSVNTPGFAFLNVTGGSAVRNGISLGSSHAAPDTLHVNIADSSSVDVGGTTTVVHGSVLDESGADNSTYYNTGLIATSGGSLVKLMSNLDGTGTISDIPAINYVGSSIELGSSVASTQSIRLDAGTLQIDKPMQFQGMIEELNPGHSPAHGRPTNPNSGQIVLANTHINGAYLQGSDLVLTNDGAMVANLHFEPLGKGGQAGLYLSNQGTNAVVAGYWVPENNVIHLSAAPATF